ncbi:MAG: hypothetical protein ABI823_17590, partial [Bryobacteraceae bacterium]
VEKHIRERYGIRVVTRDVPDPLTGDLNGAEIQIDYAVTPEQRLFLLVHLFGHTVQWNATPGAFEVGRPRHPPVTPKLMPALMAYEKEAARYAVGLLHELGITELDQWLSDSAACDAGYLRHYYSTGETRDFQSFWKDGTPLIVPKPIPPFVPIEQEWRSDGIVI